MTAVRSVIGLGSAAKASAPPAWRVVDEQRRGRFAAGEVQVRPAVGVAVERGHATADEVVEVTGVGVHDARRHGLVDVVRRPAHGLGQQTGNGQRGEGADDEDGDNDYRGDQAPVGQSAPRDPAATGGAWGDGPL